MATPFTLPQHLQEPLDRAKVALNVAQAEYDAASTAAGAYYIECWRERYGFKEGDPIVVTQELRDECLRRKWSAFDMHDVEIGSQLKIKVIFWDGRIDIGTDSWGTGMSADIVGRARQMWLNAVSEAQS